ncbi:MAG: hypothetical protein Q8T09_05720 [Candidatus Melainabacteria bacterium]|nr:hypothetical protein [Candidatus Melainabacteria bacterium]
MASHNYGEQSMSSSSFKPDVSDALRNRQGCEVAHALKGMSAGEQLDAIRGYQRESKQDPQHYPKIDVNFDKNGYEIKAKPNPETNDSSKPNKTESILKHKMDENDDTVSQSCKNEKMKPQDSMQQEKMQQDSGPSMGASGSVGSDLSQLGKSAPSSGSLDATQMGLDKGAHHGDLGDSKGGDNTKGGNRSNDDSVGPPPSSSNNAAESSSSSK